MSQHAGLSPERCAAFSLDQQVLMIANEMNRAAKLMAPADRERLRSAYERILQLADLTVQVAGRAASDGSCSAGATSWPASTSRLPPILPPTPRPCAPFSA